jgi:hypothetical protein
VAQSFRAIRGESVKQALDYIHSFVTITLVLAGLGGVSYNIFREGGWAGSVFGKLVDVQMENPVIAIPVTLGAVFVGKMWYDRQVEHGKTSKLPDIMIYVIMAAGVYFLWRFFSTGSF